ncbi:MAG: exo-alpha-sialidase [Planctomycetaceae bacterium]|nr:exo-alpha-sialidase [Planctomycetaceae bacterium]
MSVPASSSGQTRLSIERSVIVKGDSKWDWTQARTAFVAPKYCVTTMSRTAKVGSHGYHDIYLSVSKDRGQSWATPRVIPELKRERRADGYEVVAGDLCPQCHAPSGKILITGKTFNFAGGTKENILREQVSYAVLDPETGKCGVLQTLRLPERDHSNQPIIAPNAGCHQRVDLPNGEILLPIRYQRSESRRIYVTIVARCRFDGETLTYLEHGSEHSVPTNRGLYEPSIAQFDDHYFLTMRADDGAWVSKSEDGLTYSEQIPWMFNDGSSLGSYNTQQHWAIIGKHLYLIYTRRGADNDHIMRHRAPLFIGEVDSERMVVLKELEQILVPENHATLGNSGVCHINDEEVWVTVAEGRVSHGQRKGDNNRVILARIRQANR